MLTDINNCVICTCNSTTDNRYGFGVALFHLHLNTTGKVRLSSKDIYAPPKIWIQSLENTKDLDDLVEGVHQVF